MRRLLVLLLQLAVIVVVAFLLIDHPGRAHIVWHDKVIDTSASFLGLLVLVAAFVLYLLFRIWHGLRYGFENRRLRRSLKNLEQGQIHLTQGLVAIAGGHAAEAGRLAVAARKKLGTTTATLLLQAQAAQLAHDHRAARSLFLTMVERDESAVLGYRGLIMEARRAEDWDEVERLMTEVARLKPDMPWLDWVRFESASRRQAWLEAGDALARLAPTRLLDADTVRHHRAALLIATSQDEAAQGSAAAALESAEQAVKQTPNGLPALINLARRQASGDYARALRRTLEKAWAIQPHPQLADVLKGSGQDVMEIYKQLTRLCRDTENDPVSHLVLAEAALAADIWGEARRHLIALITRNQATQNAYRLLAKLERRESGDERAAMQWLTKAAEAAPDPVWLCSSCGAAHDDWHATCRACGTFATQEWRSPGASRHTTPTPAPLLSDWTG